MKIKDVAIVAGMLLTAILAITVIYMLQPHTPSESGSDAFFSKCHDVGFTEEQCKFFRYGTHEPQ
jgi:hypothetical protein